MSATLRPDLTDGIVRLRAPKPGDVAARLKLGNTPEIHHMFGADPGAVAKITKDHAQKWYHAQISEPLAWIIEHKRRMIGALRLHSVNSWDARAGLAIGILAPEMLGKGLGTRATHLIAAHAFGPLGLRRLSVRVLGYNARAVACFRKAGFVEEGRAREAAFVAGGWHDDILMGLLKTEYTPAIYDAPKRRKPAEARTAAKETT